MPIRVRHVIPVDFPEDLQQRLKAEAEAQGLKTSSYIRHLVVTHPRRSTMTIPTGKKPTKRSR